ncbi:hypothetical protein [Streptomyces sp. NPDC003015]
MWRAGRRLRWLAAAALSVQLVGAAGAHAVADAPVSTTASATEDPSGLSPEAAASQKAARSGSPVAVDAETTPTQLVTARPDGTFTVEFDPEPVRVHLASGWVPVDTDLTIAADGRLTPEAAADVTFSGGGAHDPLARITKDGKTYSVGSPWTLPSPTLDGSTATYPDVLPGTDLVVQATPDGFSENLVVKSRTAADSPELGSVRFPVSVDGVSAYDTPSGGAAFVDAQGQPVFTTGTAMMYDSSAAAAPATTGNTTAATTTTHTVTPASCNVTTTAVRTAVADQDALDGPAPGARATAMEVTASDSALTLKPDKAFLDDPTPPTRSRCALAMLRVGFVREFFEGPVDLPGIRELMRSDSEERRETAAFAVACLAGSPAVAEFTETEQCLLGCGENLVGCSSLFTDGSWVWRGDLGHYVGRHGVTLPPEFVERMREFDWKPPADAVDASVARLALQTAWHVA